MDKKELRKALRKLSREIKGKDRKRLEYLAADMLVGQICVAAQQSVIDAAEALDMEAFTLMLEVLPEIVTDLIQATIINVLGNTDEGGVETADELIKAMQVHINKPFEHNTHELWKRVQKESLEAIMRGDIDGQKVTLR